MGYFKLRGTRLLVVIKILIIILSFNGNVNIYKHIFLLLSLIDVNNLVKFRKNAILFLFLVLVVLLYAK